MKESVYQIHILSRMSQSLTIYILELNSTPAHYYIVVKSVITEID